MTAELSSNAQAILLLTAPLIAGRSKPSVDPLTAGEYRRFARRLRELQREPADLSDPGAPATHRVWIAGAEGAFAGHPRRPGTVWE